MRFALLLMLVGCATARDSAVVTLNGSAAFAGGAETSLEALDRAEQRAAVEATSSPDVARAKVTEIRARYAKAWIAYRDLRAAWLAASAAVRVYDDAERLKLGHTETAYAKAIVDLVAAESAFADAASTIRHGGAR